ncbi:helix-turn-helix transcriptional regulator [Metabacillus idriensis]|uniref:helix-turn-helix transcriptional regulator n=1 Tax=Metabacillus idriensis TaxID=324768 RepID=UPI00174E8424|nr:helix-turn-helix transcriptional regulator [Metabacillus idriensis]
MIGNRIVEIREKKFMSQADLARELNVTRSWVNKLEKGKAEPTLRMALRIANVLDCNVEDLFFLE